VNVLSPPLALPAEAAALAVSNPEMFLEAIRPWCWPMSLTRVVGKRRGVERRCA